MKQAVDLSRFPGLKPWMRDREVAQYLGIDRATVWRKAKSGDGVIPQPVDITTGTRRFSGLAIAEALAAQAA